MSFSRVQTQLKLRDIRLKDPPIIYNIIYIIYILYTLYIYIYQGADAAEAAGHVAKGRAGEQQKVQRAPGDSRRIFFKKGIFFKKA